MRRKTLARAGAEGEMRIDEKQHAESIRLGKPEMGLRRLFAPRNRAASPA